MRFLDTIHDRPVSQYSTNNFALENISDALTYGGPIQAAAHRA